MWWLDRELRSENKATRLREVRMRWPMAGSTHHALVLKRIASIVVMTISFSLQSYQQRALR